MSDLELVLMISLGVMVFLWDRERRRANYTFVVTRMFHEAFMRLARKELTLTINSEGAVVLKEPDSNKSITIA